MSKNSNVHIAVLMMVKNEHKRLHVSLESIKDFADSFVMYDTGSEDDTIEIAESFCKKHNIVFRLKTGEFVDFSTSRNVAIKFAESFDDVDYIVMLDTNDELQGGDTLRKYCETYKDKPNTGFLLRQEWWSGVLNTYYNVRMIKARIGWEYRGRVHEWPKNTRYKDDAESQANGDITIRIEEKEVVIYQDRTKDDDKSSKRFARDKVLLMEDHKENPTEPRTVFYLAQTCACLNQQDEAFYYYKLRTTLEGFWEERLHSYIKCGELSEKFNHPWEESMKWYMKAFEFNPRAEPLMKIAYHYKDKNWHLCFTFVNLACNLEFPDCLLFVDRIVYEYTRWQLLCIAGWYGYQEHKIPYYMERGMYGSEKALESSFHKEVDINNKKLYIDFAQNISQTKETKKTKSQFLKDKYTELSQQYPSLGKKNIRAKALKMWKQYDKNFL